MNVFVSAKFTLPPASALRLASDAKNLVVTDYDGDGKSDILWFESGKVTAYSLDNNNILRQMFDFADSDLSLEDKIITTGDFNGDGKLDLATPEAENSSIWNFYIGDGLSFRKFSDDIHIEYKKNSQNSIAVEEYNYVTQDLDNDGRSDFLVHHVDYSKISKNSREIVSVYYARQFYDNLSGITFHAPKISNKWISGDITKGFPLLTNRRSTHGGLYYYVRDGWSRTVASNNRNDAEMRLKRVDNGLYPASLGYIKYGSITQKIVYDQVNLYGGYLFNGTSYTPSSEQTYPYVNVNVAFDFMVVKKVTEVASDLRRTRTVRYKDFNYQGAMSHYTGLGFLGFELTAISNWYGDNVPQLWNYTKRSAALRGAVTENYTSEYSLPSESLAKFLTKYEYTTRLLDNMVFVNVPNKIISKDELHGTETAKSLTYDTHYIPLTSTTADGTTTTRESFTYYPHRTAPNNENYFVGRPKSKTVAATLDSHTFKTFEEYTYEANKIKTARRKGEGTPLVTETFSYDIWGNILSKTLSGTDMADRTETFTFTPDGRFLKTYTNVERLTTNYETDVVGNVTKVTDHLGNSTGFKFDHWSRLQEQTDYLGKKTKYLYELEWEGGWKVTTDNDNAPDTIELTNAYGWTISTSTLSLDDKWISTYYEYDITGRNTKVSEPSFDGATSWNETIYDAFGRVMEQREHTGKVTTIDYTGLSVITNDGTMSSTTEMNASGLVSKKTDDGGTITYKYYGNGTLRETEFGGMKTLVEIDNWGRKTKLTDPSAGVYTYAYNLFGEITKEETPKGATDYTYDDFGRLKTSTIIGDQTHLTLDYQYKANGLLQRIMGTDVLSAQDYTYTYGYDEYERPNSLREVNGFASFQKELTYDGYGRPKKETFITKNLSDGTESTVAVRNQYQANSGVPMQIVNDTDSASLWQLNAHDPWGHVTEAIYGNGFVHDAGYDAYGLPETVSVGRGSGTSTVKALDMVYSFDANKGRLNSRENKNLEWAESFEHDQLNRLTEVNGPAPRTHLYDLLGRIDNNDLLGGYTYDDTKKYQLAGLDLNEKGGGYYMGRERREITYNAFKKPVEIMEEEKGRVSFAYGPLGNRSHAWYGGRQVDRDVRRYRKHYSAIMPVEIIEDVEQGSVKIITYVGGDAYTAPTVHIKNSAPLSGEPEGQFYYLHRDYQGSILAITDTEGSVKEQRQFGAWGTVDKFIDSNGGDVFDHDGILDRGYTGHEHFFEVALIHMNGRMYDAQLGRFLSPDNNIQDPYSTQNFNRYGYVLNNPLMYSDPSGELFEGFGSPWGLVSLFARLLGFAAPDLFSGGLDSANNWGSIETAPTPNGKSQGPIQSNATPEGGLEGAWSDSRITGVAGNLKFAKNQSKEFKNEINGYIRRIGSTDVGNMVLSELVYGEGIIEISEVESVLQSMTTAEASANGKSITGNATIQTSLGTLFHDGAMAAGITTFAHELWHAYQVSMGSETYISLYSARDGLYTKYSEIQAVGFENYIRGVLGIYGNPYLNYSSRDNPLNSRTKYFSAPINLYTKPGKYFGRNKWDTEDFTKGGGLFIWRTLHLKTMSKHKN